MKNYKCIKCNNKLDSVELGMFKKRLSLDCREEDDHYFCLDLDDYDTSNKVNELSYYKYDIQGFPVYYLEIIFQMHKYYYFFKTDKSTKRHTINLDDFILNDLYNKFLNETLTVDCIENTISKLENLAIFI